jgi:hypothetical protein
MPVMTIRRLDTLGDLISSARQQESAGYLRVRRQPAIAGYRCQATKNAQANLRANALAPDQVNSQELAFT